MNTSMDFNAHMNAQQQQSLIDRIITFCTSEHCLIGVSLFRIITGICVLYGYLVHYHQRYYLWGPNGALSLSNWGEAPDVSLYAISSSPLYFDLIFHLGILSAVMWTIGWKTRLMGVLAFVFRYSLYSRNTLIAHGGDNLNVIVHVYLLFANTGAYFSVDAMRSQVRATAGSLRLFGRQVLGAVHNTALVASVLQLCLVYTMAGLHKANGSTWKAGTALYYILQVQEYSSPYSHLLYSNDYLLLLFSYATICFQLGFTMSLFNRYTRFIWILGGMGFHLGIAIFMGLTTFSLLMVAVYPMLITDHEYKWAWARLSQALTERRLIIFYDAECQFCAGNTKWWKMIDLASLIEFRSSHAPGLSEAPEGSVEDMKGRIYVQPAGGGRSVSGLDALVAITKRLVILWPLLPVFWIVRLVGRGDMLCAYVASRHSHTILFGSCSESPCAMPGQLAPSDRKAV